MAHAVVIGAGMGGLSAALELLADGWDVTVVEKESTPGGKMREIQLGDRAADGGPTVLTMRWVFEALFERVGRDLASEVDLIEAECLARHAWQDGSRLDLFVDDDRSAAAIGEFAGAAEARGYREFCNYTRSIWQSVYQPFVAQPEPSLGALTKAVFKGGLGLVRKIDPARSMWRSLGRFFNDDRLQQLFGRYATYVGCSPFQAPATLNLIAHVETEGVWMVRGGMFRLAETMARLVEECGGTLRFDSPVSRIIERGGRAVAVEMGDTILSADVVVSNVDIAALSAGRFGRSASAAVPDHSPSRRTLSALTWSTVTEPEGFELEHHNVFFSNDYEREFNELFGQRRLPTHPTVYVCAQDRGSRQARPSGEEVLFCLVNAPAVGDQGDLDSKEIERCQKEVESTLARCGLQLRLDPERTVISTPGEFEALSPGSGGAIYGEVNHSWRASLRRNGVRSKLKGLYLTGGSVHPGAGVPMVTLSGHLAARAVREDHRSTVQFLKTGMRGGTSTRSAMMAASD